MTRVNIADAKARLSELIDDALGGEEIVIARRNVPLVKLTVVAKPARRPKFGMLAGVVRMTDDFDAPVPELAEYSR